MLKDAPSAPRNLQATDITSSSVTIRWQTPSNDGGLPIKSYTVERRDKKYGSYTKVDTIKAPSTTCVVERLQLEKEYYFRITATNEEGTSPPAEMSEPVKLVKEPGMQKAKQDNSH